MSEKTEQQIALENRVSELSINIGKKFKRKDGKDNRIVSIIGYGGVKTKDGASYHTLIAEAKGMRWTPPAVKFFEEYEEVEIKPETQTETKHEYKAASLVNQIN